MLLPKVLFLRSFLPFLLFVLQQCLPFQIINPLKLSFDKFPTIASPSQLTFYFFPMSVVIFTFLPKSPDLKPVVSGHGKDGRNFFWAIVVYQIGFVQVFIDSPTFQLNLSIQNFYLFLNVTNLILYAALDVVCVSCKLLQRLQGPSPYAKPIFNGPLVKT